MESTSLTKYQLSDIIDQSKCPDCNNPLMGGPTGGIMRNILCSNPHCRQEFNIDVTFGLSGYRSGKANEERAQMFGPRLVFCKAPTEVAEKPSGSMWSRFKKRLKGGL